MDVKRRIRYQRYAFGDIPGVPGIRMEKGGVPEGDYELVVTPGDLARQAGRAVATYCWYPKMLADLLRYWGVEGDYLVPKRLALRQDCLDTCHWHERQQPGGQLLVRRMRRVSGPVGHGRVVRADPIMAISMVLSNPELACDLIEGIQGWLLPGLEVHAEGYRLPGVPMLVGCGGTVRISHCTEPYSTPHVSPLYFCYV